MTTKQSAAIEFRKRVLNFWFSNNRWSSGTDRPSKSAPVDETDISRWFFSNKEFDDQVRVLFESDLQKLINDEYRYTGDSNDPEHILACIITLDQFPRNIYRRDPRAFAFDHKAKELSELLMENRLDKHLPYVERTFVYLPFTHSESMDDQNRGVAYLEELYEDSKKDVTSTNELIIYLKKCVVSGEQHRDIIKEFGRFPHRNEALNRVSLQNEIDYLQNKGQRFGQ